MNDDDQKKIKRLSWWMVALLYLGLLLFITLLISLFTQEKIFYNLAAGIIISWIIALIAYYFWAIYFYNVNMGWEDADWSKQDALKKKDPELAEKEPEVNPNAKETLGLPPGTVRATLALTLLIGAMALMLASLELPHKMEQNSLFIDNYEFLKTAFLMMVAFYFGNKSLDFLKDRNPVHGSANAQLPAKEMVVETLPSPVTGNETKEVLKKGPVSEITDDGKVLDFNDNEAQG